MGNSLILLVALALAGCGWNPPVDGPGGAEECPKTCAHYERLGCIEAEPSPERGIPCVEVCEIDAEFLERPHDCIQSAKSCEATRACE